MNRADTYRQIIEDLAHPGLSVAEANQLFDLKDKMIPARLFKYFPPNERSFEALSKRSVWVCNPTKFNDPYDSGLTAELNMSSGLEKMGNMLHNAGSLLSAEEHENVIAALKKVADERQGVFLSEFETVLRNLLKVTCFSESGKSLLMWGHYARKHAGFVVEYETSTWQTDMNQNLRKQFYPVVYDNVMFDASRHLSLDAPEATPKNIYLGIAAACNKATDWSYEEEWRLVIGHGALPKDGYVPIPGIKRVISGARMLDGDKMALRAVLAPLGIPHAEAKLRRGFFEIVIDG